MLLGLDMFRPHPQVSSFQQESTKHLGSLCRQVAGRLRGIRILLALHGEHFCQARKWLRDLKISRYSLPRILSRSIWNECSTITQIDHVLQRSQVPCSMLFMGLSAQGQLWHDTMLGPEDVCTTLGLCGCWQGRSDANAGARLRLRLHPLGTKGNPERQGRSDLSALRTGTRILTPEASVSACFGSQGSRQLPQIHRYRSKTSLKDAPE